MQTMIKPVKACSTTPKRGLELIDGHHRLSAAAQLFPEVEVPVRIVKASARTPKHGLAMEDLLPDSGFLAVGHTHVDIDRFFSRIAMANTQTPESSVETQIQQGLLQLSIDGVDQQAHTLPR